MLVGDKIKKFMVEPITGLPNAVCAQVGMWSSETETGLSVLAQQAILYYKAKPTTPDTRFIYTFNRNDCIVFLHELSPVEEQVLEKEFGSFSKQPYLYTQQTGG